MISVNESIAVVRSGSPNFRLHSFPCCCKNYYKLSDLKQKFIILQLWRPGCQ